MPSLPPSIQRLAAGLLGTPLALFATWPVGALPLTPGPRPPASESRLAQAPAKADPAIPMEVQGWVDAAKAADSKGDAAEALRLQRKVVAWVETHLPPWHLFRARAMNNLGNFLAAAGQSKQALAASEEAVRILRLDASHPDVPRLLAIALSNLVVRYSEQRRGQEALLANESAVKIYRALARKDPSYLNDLANSLTNLGAIYRAFGRHQQALSPAEEAVKIYRDLAKTNSASRIDLAMALTTLGIRYSELGRRQEALAPAEEAVAILRDLAKKDPSLRLVLAKALNDLGLHYSNLGQRKEALAPTENALQIFRDLVKSNQTDPGDLARALNNMGMRYSDLGRYQDAQVATEEAVKMFRDLAKTKTAYLGDLASALDNLGVHSSALGQRQQALAFTTEAVRIYRDLAKTEPAYLGDLALALNNLAKFRGELGQRQEALSLAEEVVTIFRELAKTNPAYRGDLAMALNNVGAGYRSLGRPQEALAPTEEAVKIYRDLAKTNPAYQNDLAMALANLGVFYTELGRSQEALEPTTEAVRVRRELAKTNPAFLADLAIALNNLGNSYRRVGRRQEALAPSEEAVRIFRVLANTTQAHQGDLANALNNLGVLYSDLGRPQEALAPREEAVNILGELKRTNPAYQEDFARSATNLAILRLQRGDPRAALTLLRESVGSEVIDLQAQLPLLPEGRRLTLLDAYGRRWQLPFSQAQQDDGGADLALFTRLNRRGLLQDIQRSQALLARNGPWQPVVAKLKAVTTELANITLTQEQRTPLLARKERLEQELYRQLPEIKPHLVEPARIARLLPADGVLVEFQRYPSVDLRTRRYGPLQYLALLLKPDGTSRAIPLGEAAPIDEAVAVAVTASAAANQQAEAPQRLAAVSRLVLTPLAMELAGVRELFLSPDGELNRLPFAALPMADPDGLTLGKSVQLRLLTSGRDLLRLRQPSTAGGPAVLVANPDFDAAGGSYARRPAPGRLAAAPSPSPGGFRRWEPLAGTKREADQLAPLLRLRPEAVISGRQATAALVLRQKGPRILHVATHGFFQDEQQALPDSSSVTISAAIGDPAISGSAGISSGPSPALNTTGTGAPARSASLAGSSASGEAGAGGASADGTPQPNDPLQRSGLVFAGANRPTANPADDGYLTAAEATAMDLEGTELVTLSACETGRGGVRSGEGVYGLQRSLAVAGARSTLLSLWKVDDAATAAFMAHYYTLLEAGVGRADALRQTQAFFRAHKNSTYNDIRVWGAFQLSGDWRPLPRW